MVSTNTRRIILFSIKIKIEFDAAKVVQPAMQKNPLIRGNQGENLSLYWGR
jgi:hypothetical protein